MRKGTVRDMKKNVLLRGLFGIPTGIAIGYVITVMMSAFWGDGSYYPCVPAFVDAMGSEIRAVAVQTVLCGLVGMVYAAGIGRVGSGSMEFLPVRRRRIF